MVTNTEKVAAAIAGVLFVGVVGFQSMRDAELREVIQREIESVDTAIRHDPQFCESRSDSLLVRLGNEADRNINYTEFSVSARIPGFSNEVTLDSEPYQTDKIIKPGEAWTSCFEMPNLSNAGEDNLNRLEWEVNVLRVYFERGDLEAPGR